MQPGGKHPADQVYQRCALVFGVTKPDPSSVAASLSGVESVTTSCALRFLAAKQH